MIKIAFVIDTIVSPTAGTERQLLLLIKNLDKTRFAPMLFCLRSSAWIEEHFNLCPLYVIGIHSFKKPSSIKRLFEFSGLLKTNRVDIVQTFFRDANLAGVIGARLAGIRAIISSRRGVPLWSGGLSLGLLRVLNRLVPAFIANCETTRKWVAEKEGIPIERIHVVNNAVDATLFRDITAEARKRYRAEMDIPQNVPVIGIVANLRPVKCVDVFLDAARLVHVQLPSARFVIVGDGAERARLMSMVSESGLNEYVRFLGQRLDVIPLLSAFDIGVLSSSFESFPNAVVEYLAAGIPVVCTDVGGCHELIRDREKGFIVPPGDARSMADAMLSLTENIPYSTSPRADWSFMNGRFSIKAVLTQHETIYRNLVNAQDQQT